MISRIDLRGQRLDRRTLRRVIPRAATDVAAAAAAVTPVVEDVAEHGWEALRRWGQKFDGVFPATPRVPRAALDQALADLDPDVRRALEVSIAHARTAHAAQLRDEVRTEVVPGGTVTERFLPVARVGLYAPGGLAAYPSSVVMNVVPAQIAGVGSIALASPPQRDNDGLPHPTVLAAAALLGITEVYAVGGAQAVALFAYGADAEPGTGSDTEGAPEVEPVDLITGPGNVFVAAAKRLVRGVVGIDAEAGPTEILVLADETANPDYVAADLVSQAEHDPMAASVLVTDSSALADAVEAALVPRARDTANAERVRAALSGPQSAIVLVDDLEAGLTVTDAYAAEHLEVQTRDAAAVARRVRNAGAIFVGDYAPVSLGDYAAGSNHVLPTSGTAAHSSGLSVASFLKETHVVDYDREALAGVAEAVQTLAAAEHLPAHGEAVAARFA